MIIKRNYIIILIITMCFTVISTFAADFTVHKLPNGQILIVKEIHTNPIVTIDTWVKTGSINENEINNGVSHFLEHLFFKGTKLHPAGELDKILEGKGAVVNAATSKDFTHYYIKIPSSSFDTALELHADMLQNPQIPPKEMEKERNVVLEEIAKDENTPSKKVYENLNSMMYTNHPYKRKVIGSAKIISTITRENILEYFNKYYMPSNMVTVIVGDINTEYALQQVTQHFNKKSDKITKNKIHKELPLQSNKQKTEYMNTQSGYMMIGFRTADIMDKDIYALDVLAEILGGGKSSRLYRNVKEQKNLAYSISSSNVTFKDDGILFINTNFTPANIEKLKKAIFDEIIYIQKNGITQEELNTAKKIIESDTFYSRESTSDIAGELGYIMTLSGQTELYDKYVDNINKVSINDVRRVAQKYLGKSKSAISIALPEKEKCTNIKTDKTEHKATKISENSNITKYLLDNKSVLLVNPHKNNDIIAINIIAKGGYFLEKTGSESLLAAKCMLNGTKKYSSQELTRLMEENGIEITPTASEDFFMINVKTTTSQLDFTLEILDEIINNSLYDEQELNKKSYEILAKIRQKQDIPMNVALENYKSHIFENGIYSHSNKYIEKNLPKVSREDVLNYYNKIFDSKNIVISVNGNVQNEKLINAFSDIFTDKKQPEFKYSGLKMQEINTPKNIIATKKDLQTAWMFLGWQTNGIQNTKDFATLKIIDTLLGSGLSSRLYRNLREQDGLAYQLGSTYTPNAFCGNFVTFIGTNPETLKYSEEKIKSEISKLKMEFVSDSELQQVKNRLKGSFVIALETNSKKASNTGLFEAYGLGYDFLDKYIKLIDDITASDIVRVANKYFNNNYVKSVIK